MVKEKEKIMFSKNPILVEKLSKENVEKELLRMAIIAELDTTSLYEQMAEMTSNNDLKKVFLDVAKEEKTHTGEFEEMLRRLDKEQVEENKKGEKEVKELTGK